MSKNKIAINFSQLKNQEFEFTVYRKARPNNDSKEKFPFARERKLPGKDGAYASFWVSYAPGEGFEPYVCSSHTNIDLTKSYLLEQLISRCKEVLGKNDFIVEGISVDKSSEPRRVYFVLDNFSEGKQVVWVEPYYLKIEQKIGFLFDFKFLNNVHGVSGKVLQLSLSLNVQGQVNKTFYADRYNKLKSFAHTFYGRVFRDTLLDFDGNEMLECKSLSNKYYIVGGNNEVDYPQKLRTFGPFGEIKKECTIYFYVRPEEVQIVKEFYPRLESELKQKFHVKFQFKSQIVNAIGKQTLDDLINRIKSESSAENSCLVISLLRSKMQDNDTYYLVKYRLTTAGIPIQFITYPTIKNKFSLENITLQVFSKLGGTPWKMRHRSEKCLIIGLANKRYKDGGVQYAYSVLLDASGIYKELKAISGSADRNTYLRKLGVSITEILTKYGEDYKKVVIHTPFKLVQDELDRINDSLKKFANKDIEFLVLRINTKNKFFGYNKAINSLIPYECSYVNLSERDFLIWFEGLRKNETVPQKRYSGPTHVEFHYSNLKHEQLTQEKCEDYLQDIVNLSGANWRGFNARSLPVSIYYCKIISNFIKEFKIRDFDDINFGNIQPWFL